MKQTFLILLILFPAMHSLTSCVKKETETSKPPIASLLKYDERFAATYLDSLRTLDSSKTQVNTEVMLGFRFGMSKKEYQDHFDSLATARIIRHFRKTCNTFQLQSGTQDPSPELEIHPFFIRNKLARIELLAWSETLSATEVKVGLQSIYSKKYGPRIEANNASYWFLKNMEVQLTTRQTKENPGIAFSEHATVLYIDNSQTGPASK